ncbi:MAG: hypothetical protein JXA30_12560 [Deltaproteobacteria bacterium]|nr:hypothetical protein [Deltaproteobacteria bacterium]
MNTRIELHERAAAEVTMTIRIAVRGGWLSRFEINGLDSDFALDANRLPVLVSEQGRGYRPEIQTRSSGILVFNFKERRHAPRRGTYTCELFYTTALLSRALQDPRAKTARLQWSLPPWHAGLQDVQIEVAAPRGSRPLALASEESFLEHRRFIDSENQTLLHWRRFHLPRTVAWTIGFTIPRNRAVTPVDRPDVPKPKLPETRTAAGASAGWVALVVGFFALLKRLLVDGVCRRRRVEAIALVALGSARLRYSLLLCFVVISYFAFDRYQSIALALCCLLIILSIDKAYRRSPVRTQGIWRSVSERDLRTARLFPLKDLFGMQAWLDATTPLGFSLLLSGYVLSYLLFRQGDGDYVYFWSCGVLLVTPLFFTGTRKSLPLSPEIAINLLRNFARRSSLDSLASFAVVYDLLLYQIPSGDWCEARLRFRSDTFADGLHRLDLVIADFPAHQATSHDIALLSVTCAGSAADRILNTLFRNALTYSAYSGNQIARLTRSSDLKADIRNLIGLLIINPSIGAKHLKWEPQYEHRSPVQPRWLSKSSRSAI